MQDLAPLHGEELLDRVDDLCRTESRPAFMHARLLQFDGDHVGWRGGATGSMRFGRNLTESEILDQALHFRRQGPVNHAVYMGMGEPFLNFDAARPSRPSAGCRASGVSSTRSRSRSGSRCRSTPQTRQSARS